MKQLLIILGIAAVVIVMIIGGGIYAISYIHGISISDIGKMPGVSTKKAERLAHHKIIVGDTANDVIQGWGNPQDKNIYEYAHSRKEQWIYYYPLGHKYRDKWNPYYVYVEYSSFNSKGKVTSIQY